MKADFSRLTFDPAKHYAGVLHQQGRVWLDSDWNEDILDRLHLLEEETFDIIGACGVPDPGTAFAISASPNPGDFLIAGGPGPEGRYYVDGILCQLDATNASYHNQPDYPDPPPLPAPPQEQTLYGVVYLEVWRRLITYLEDDVLREIALGGPDTASRLKTVVQVKVQPAPAGTKLTCDTAGDYLPRPGSGALTTLQPTNLQPDDLCRLPDPANYTGRENHLYRVEIHDAGEVINSGKEFTQQLGKKASAGDATLKLSSALTQSQSDALSHSSAARLVDDDGQNESVTVMSISGTTLTLASPLIGNYALARHPTLTNIARFKWSRDNAAFAVRVRDVDANRQTLTLSSLGRDQATALHAGDLVEICDDATELGPARGHLTYLSGDPDPDLLTVTLADPFPASFHLPPADRHMLLRRWDGTGQANTTFDATTTPDMDFGDGVHIQFSGSDLRSGDYWQFAARALDGSVEPLTNAPPMGIIRHICPLAIIHWSQADQLPPVDTSGPAPAQGSTVVVDEDCRQPFNPLTKQHGDCACDCTVAVAPGDNLKDAIAKIGSDGGVICLLPGKHPLTDTLTITGKVGLTIRGSGAAVIVAPPQSPTALVFEGCQALTLRDFGVVGLSSAAPRIAGMAGAGSGIAGLITCINCQAVEVFHCLVASSAQVDERSLSAGIAFYSTSGGDTLANLTQSLRQLAQGAGAIDFSKLAAAPSIGANLQKLAAQGQPLPGLDLTVRDCRILVDVGQYGILVADSVGVSIEDNKLLPFIASGVLQGKMTDPNAILKAVQARRGGFGMWLGRVASVLIANNLTLGFNTALMVYAPNDLSGTDVTVRGNSSLLCGRGLISYPSGMVRLSENSIAVDTGPAVQVMASVAVLADNSFLAQSAAALTYAVLVEGANITYTGNQSVCTTLPTLTNVYLRGQVEQKKMTSITALGNTCREPTFPTTTATGKELAALLANSANIANKQIEQIITPLMKGAMTQTELQQQIANFTDSQKGQWPELQNSLDHLLRGQEKPQISLLAVGEVAITGANLLSYLLVRLGRGSDQGSVSAVF